METLYRTAGLAATLMFTVFIAGCEEPPPTTPVIEAVGGEHEHDHDGAHKHAETFADAFAEVKELRDKVAEAFAAKDPNAADDPLHELPHLLEELSALSDASGLSDEAKKQIESNIATLFEAFDAVHGTMHGGKDGKPYGEVADKVTAAIDSIAKAAGELAEGEGHDHDGHEDHKEHAEHGETSAHHEGHDKDDADHKDGHDKKEGHSDDDHKADKKPEGESAEPTKSDETE